VEKVVMGTNGVRAGLQKGAIVMDMGTTRVASTKELAREVQAQGAEYVDAPVSGGQVGAEQGTLSIMAGATEEAFATVKPVLEAMGKNVTRIGDIGAGQVAKAANQIIVGTTIGAVAEALTLAKRAGVDPAVVREALCGGFASSRILELHGKRMVEGNFVPGGRCTTQRKDMFQALEYGESLGLDLPLTSAVKGMYDSLITEGHGDLDHSALVKIIEGEVPHEPQNQ